MSRIKELKEKIIAGGSITAEEAYSLADISSPEERAELWESAREITRKCCSRVFDSCSIVNARSGKCPENCKWCAQSTHHNTVIETYPLISKEECMKIARLNRSQGIRRFSLVTSGRKLTGKPLDTVCEWYSELHREGGISLCASMGLLQREDLQKLYDAGVRRYHCNLEAAPSFFPTLCSTHTVEDKINTINIAREIGFEVCSGGIIGMGETPRQRIELALELLRIDPASIPINILCPIPGTPLENAASLTDEEILDCLSCFRFIHPTKILRFAGGRAKLSRDTQLKALEIGMNGAVMGDLLTTIGSKVNEDKQLIDEADYTF